VLGGQEAVVLAERDVVVVADGVRALILSLPVPVPEAVVPEEDGSGSLSKGSMLGAPFPLAPPLFVAHRVEIVGIPLGKNRGLLT
jgi:hypothetical protein